MLQGANIVMAAMKEGSLPKLDGIEKIENEIRTTRKGFEYVAEIQEHCFAWYAMEVTKNEPLRRLDVTDDSSLFGGLYAAFCLELIDMLESQKELNADTVEIVPTLLARFHAIWKQRKNHDLDHQGVADKMADKTTTDEWERFRVAKNIKKTQTIVAYFKKLSESWTTDSSRIPSNLK
jgi:hypothetical protein